MLQNESQRIEYKQKWTDECLKAISAMANGEGGTLYIGVDDTGIPVSLKNPKKMLEDIPNIIRNKLSILPSVELVEEKGKEIVRITVFPSTIPISHHGKYYLRSGSTVQELNGKNLADFLMEKAGITWDNVIENRCNVDDLDKSTIETFKKYAQERIPGISGEAEITTLLHKLKLIHNRKLKRAAILLFGSDPQYFYGHAVIRIGKFASDTDVLTTDIVNGNLFRQLDVSLEILRTKYLQSNISYEGIRRRDILEYPYEALREAIINALIHRDYSGYSQIQIRVYPDKMFIMNEGGLPPEIKVEDLKKNHLSKPRNQLLADIFYYAGFIESWGRGTLKIVENCLSQGLPEPDFHDHHGTMTVTIYKDKWNEENLKKLGLNERQIKAVMYVKEKGKITNKEYQSISNISNRTSTRDLAQLVSMNILEQIGVTGKGTKYVLRRHKDANNAIKTP